MRNWPIGRGINVSILRHQRADYGKQIVAKLSHQLTWSHIVELLPTKSMTQFSRQWREN
jgi:hypothetical protein